jgi:hypothetical protein
MTSSVTMFIQDIMYNIYNIKCITYENIDEPNGVELVFYMFIFLQHTSSNFTCLTFKKSYIHYILVRREYTFVANFCLC